MGAVCVSVAALRTRQAERDGVAAEGGGIRTQAQSTEPREWRRLHQPGRR